MEEELLLGWAGDIAEECYAALADNFVSSAIVGDALQRPGKPIWEFSKKLNNGQHLPTWRQLSLDCVTMGATQAGQYLHTYEIARQGQEEIFKYWFPPWLYYTSRILVGRGRLGRRGGSTGSWAAQAVMQYGILNADDQGVPQYSKALVDQWGSSGPDQDYTGIAKQRLIKSAARLTSVDEIRMALINYKPCTFAIDWVYGQSTQTKVYQDHNILQREASIGGHQVCLLAWMDDPFPAAYLLNSWGSQMHGSPCNGEPPGGAWIRAEDLSIDLRSGRCEVYAYSQYDGLKGEANWAPFSVAT